MPTPFMHLAAAHQYLNDDAVPQNLREWLGDTAQLGAFLLGNVAPDARVSGGLNRNETHFFDYVAQIRPHAVDNMLGQYPQLSQAVGPQRAFIAGYIAHLAMDVVWAEAMLFPFFYQQEDWADPPTRYLMLHVLLCALDAEDYMQWPKHFAGALAEAQPDSWVPFLPDESLAGWRDIIAGQICDDCPNRTNEILGGRVALGQAGLEALLHSETRMNNELWAYVPPKVVEEVRVAMYAAMVAYVNAYLESAAAKLGQTPSQTNEG